MKRYDLLTPEGTRDLLFDECVARRLIEDRIRSIFISNGYSEIITPGIEFLDVFSKTGYLSEESMYKTFDSKGRLIAVRPDTTMAIARLVATRLRGETLPLKLFYNQNIFRASRKDSGRDDEITQSGIEIIGGDIRRSDLEILTLALEVLDSCEAEDFRLEIGNSALFKYFLSNLKVSEEDAEEIRSFIETKNYPELHKKLEPYSDNENAIALMALPKLFGEAKVFDMAEQLFEDKKAISILNNLKEVFETLCEFGYRDKIVVDLGIVNRANYYTGILFRGYTSEYGKSIISGGRYDTLVEKSGETVPATGFAVNINAAASALLKKSENKLTKTADVLIFLADNNFKVLYEHSKNLINEGKIVDNSVLKTKEEALIYAESKGILQIDILENGKCERILNEQKNS